MIELAYSLVIEATEEPDYFGFYSPDLEGFSGIGHSIEDCLFKAKWGKDLYDIKGKHRKININMNYEDALTYADDDINENWQIYRHRFLEGDMS
jgi:hypothetical protein